MNAVGRSIYHVGHTVRKRTFVHVGPAKIQVSPTHSGSLIRIFMGRIMDSQWVQSFLKHTTKTARMRTLIRVDRAHVSEGTFSHIAANIAMNRE